MEEYVVEVGLTRVVKVSAPNAQEASYAAINNAIDCRGAWETEILDPGRDQAYHILQRHTSTDHHVLLEMIDYIASRARTAEEAKVLIEKEFPLVRWV